MEQVKVLIQQKKDQVRDLKKEIETKIYQLGLLNQFVQLLQKALGEVDQDE